MSRNRHKPPRALMLQGTASNAGKSLLVAGLARAYAKRGVAVRPFKPQNMSNNAAVAADGGEIGRAQALQARAAYTAPSVHMNPVLLKPQSDIGAQVVVQGRVWGTARAADYHALKPELLPRVLESFATLGEAAELVLVEGAGSPAEVNLRPGDIANMGFAQAAGVPVVLVADVDRGGALAAIVGTWELLDEAEHGLLKGYLVNKFRGDAALFDEATEIIGRRTGLESFGVVPHMAAARRLPAEDAVALDSFPAVVSTGAHSIKIAVPRLVHIANFDDLDPLIAEAHVAVDMVEAGRALPGDADLVVLPGSKSTLADLEDLRAEGWDIDIAAHVRRGGWLLGLCGGYQMLGTRIADPAGIEGAPGEARGLGLLAVETELAPEKRLTEIHGTDVVSGAAVRGYEMHLGETRGPDRNRPMLEFGGRTDGARSADGRVMGCYLHGLFTADAFRHGFLERLAGHGTWGAAYEHGIEAALDAIAAGLDDCLDLDRLWEVSDGA